MDRFDRAHTAKLVSTLAVLLHTVPAAMIEASRTQAFALLAAVLMIMQIIVALCSDAIWQKASLVVASGCVAFVASFIWVFCS